MFSFTQANEYDLLDSNVCTCVFISVCVCVCVCVLYVCILVSKNNSSAVFQSTY